MKFIDSRSEVAVYFTTKDNIEYRTTTTGECWERRYGESWETVWGTEEDECKEQFKLWYSGDVF
jgi:hypothetical protein